MINYKIKLVSILVSGLSLMVMNNVQAINPNAVEKIEDRKEKIAQKKTEILCGRIENVVTRLEKNIDSDRINLRERSEERIREMKENGESREAELEERRIMRDETREKFYSELEEKAGDDSAKKTAVKNFKTTVEKAIQTRREAIDNAKKTMNTGIDQSIQTRTENGETLRTEFKAEIEKLISEAKNVCDEDTTSVELKDLLSKLKEDVKIARDNYKAKLGKSKKVQETIQQLREERKSTVKTAIENFKATIKVAQEELKLAMGSQSN
jgi:hypothetical protein